MNLCVLPLVGSHSYNKSMNSGFSLNRFSFRIYEIKIIYLQGNQGRLTSIGIRSALAQLVNASSGPALPHRNKMLAQKI